MKHFLIGTLAGFLLTAVLCFSLKPTIQYDLGRLLDEDIVYLKGGAVIQGWIEQEDANSILIRTKSDSLVVPRSKCSAIHKNVRLYYMRALM